MSDALCICVSSATAAGYTGLENSCIEQRTLGQSLTRELRLTIMENTSLFYLLRLPKLIPITPPISHMMVIIAARHRNQADQG